MTSAESGGDIRHGAVRAKRSMGLIRAEARLSDDMSRAAKSCGNIASLSNHDVFCFCRAHLFVKTIGARQCGSGIPRYFQLLRRANCIPFIGSDNSDKISAAHHACAGDTRGSMFRRR